MPNFLNYVVSINITIITMPFWTDFILFFFTEACKLMSSLTCSIPEFTCVSSAKVIIMLFLSSILLSSFFFVTQRMKISCTMSATFNMMNCKFKGAHNDYPQIITVHGTLKYFFFAGSLYSSCSLVLTHVLA